MPRQPRYFIPGLPQHVIQRGVDSQAVFFQDSDYQLYREALRTAARDVECQIHAYILMTNHTHLLVAPGSKRSLPRLMQAMGRTYVEAVNRKYNRTGPLWQGRYKSSLVQDDAYLLNCYRYVELNPVRAGMTRGPGDYPYSSYARNAVGKSDSLITEHPVYRSLATTPDGRRVAYRNLFADEFDDELLTYIRDTTNACRVMGHDRFKDQIEAMLGRSVRRARLGRPRMRDKIARLCLAVWGSASQRYRYRTKKVRFDP